MVKEHKEKQKARPATAKGQIRRPPRDPPETQRIQDGNDVTEERLSSDDVADPMNSLSAESQQIISDIFKIVFLALQFSLLLYHREIIYQSRKVKLSKKPCKNRRRPQQNSLKVTFFRFGNWHSIFEIEQQLLQDQNRLAFFLNLDLFRDHIGIQKLRQLKHKYDQGARMRQKVERKLMDNHPREDHTYCLKYIEQYDRGMEAFGLYLEDKIYEAFFVYWGKDKCKRTDTRKKAYQVYLKKNQSIGVDPNQPNVPLMPDERLKFICRDKEKPPISELPTTINQSVNFCSQNLCLDEEMSMFLQLRTEDCDKMSQLEELRMKDMSQMQEQLQTESNCKKSFIDFFWQQ